MRAAIEAHLNEYRPVKTDQYQYQYKYNAPDLI